MTELLSFCLGTPVCSRLPRPLHVPPQGLCRSGSHTWLLRATDSKVFLRCLRRAVAVQWRVEFGLASIPEELGLLPRIKRVVGPLGFGERETQMRDLAVCFCRYASVLMDELSIGATPELRLAHRVFAATLRALVRAGHVAHVGVCAMSMIRAACTLPAQLHSLPMMHPARVLRKLPIVSHPIPCLQIPLDMLEDCRRFILEHTPTHHRLSFSKKFTVEALAMRLYPVLVRMYTDLSVLSRDTKHTMLAAVSHASSVGSGNVTCAQKSPWGWQVKKLPWWEDFVKHRLGCVEVVRPDYSTAIIFFPRESFCQVLYLHMIRFVPPPPPFVLDPGALPPYCVYCCSYGIVAWICVNRRST